jgi:Flp pilus assembly pilin Flp
MFKFLRNSKGQGMVEYILIIVVVVAVVLVGYKLFGNKLSGAFEKGGTRIDQEATAAFATTTAR